MTQTQGTFELHEHDDVRLCGCVGGCAAGSRGTVVHVYQAGTAAEVEVAEGPDGRALPLQVLTVPVALLCPE